MKGTGHHELISEWTSRGKASSAQASRHLAELLDEALRRRGDVQHFVQLGAQHALLSVASATRRQIDELQHGLDALSAKLKALERQAGRRRSPVRRRRAAAAARPRHRSARAETSRRKAA